MEKLEQAQKLVEQLISQTPTGELRNSLTDINILILTGQQEIIDKKIELLDFLKKW